MALSSTSATEFMTVRSAYNLQTQQKRLRHLRSIAVRNLRCGGQMKDQITHLQCYFTLHRDSSTQAFYTSEKITSSTNPSWQSFDISRYEDEVDLASKFFVLRVWVGQDDKFRLLITMEVHLSGLHFLAEKLQQSLVKHTPNTVIFGMLDKYFIFINKEQAQVKTLARKVADLELPSSLLPAVVKVEKSSVRHSYNASSLTRIQTVLRAIKQMQAHARRYRRQIEDRQIASQENTQRLEEREQLHMRVGQLRQELLRRTTQLHAAQERLQTIKEAARVRGQTLKQEVKEVTQNAQLLGEDKKDHNARREQLVKENALLNLRRRQMLSELTSYIYPITEENNKYFINGVRLPQAEEFQGQDETMIAVGLGYACHLTIKISQILGLPLRHPMENRGSRSVIFDQVHSRLADKDREFPLYSKSRDKFHFNYGVFLLNKNISQLRFQCQIPTLDLRLVLQNLQTLLQRLGVRMDGGAAAAQTVFEISAFPAATSFGSSIASCASAASITSAMSAANGQVARYQESTEVDQLNGQKSKTGARKGRNAEVEEGDEAEEIFHPPAEDDFFQSGNSFTRDFSEAKDAEDGITNIKGTRGGDVDSQLSERLQTASSGETLAPRSFKLVSKPSNSGSSQQDDAGDSRPTDNDGGAVCDGAGNINSNNSEGCNNSNSGDVVGSRNAEVVTQLQVTQLGTDASKELLTPNWDDQDSHSQSVSDVNRVLLKENGER